jgi:hypothetical protein
LAAISLSPTTPIPVSFVGRSNDERGGNPGVLASICSRVGLIFSWGAASMEETALGRNNLSMLLLHLSVAPSGGVGGQVARSSRRSPDPARFVFGGRRSVLLRATVMSAAIVVFAVSGATVGA